MTEAVSTNGQTGEKEACVKTLTVLSLLSKKK